MNEAYHILTGDKSIGYYIACLLFSLGGIIISLYASSRKRDPLSKNTPYHFSLKFLFWDSTKRIIPTLIVMYFLFRLLPMGKGKISDGDLLLMIGVGVGVTIAFDQLIALFMQTSEMVCNVLSMNRKKFMDNYENNSTNNPPGDTPK